MRACIRVAADASRKRMREGEDLLACMLGRVGEKCGFAIVFPCGRFTGRDVSDAVAVLVHGNIAALAEDDVVWRHAQAATAHRAQCLLVLLAACHHVHQLPLNNPSTPLQIHLLVRMFGMSSRSLSAGETMCITWRTLSTCNIHPTSTAVAAFGSSMFKQLSGMFVKGTAPGSACRLALR